MKINNWYSGYICLYQCCYTFDWCETKGNEIALRAGSEILLATKSSNIIVDENIDFKAMGVVIGV